MKKEEMRSALRTLARQLADCFVENRETQMRAWACVERGTHKRLDNNHSGALADYERALELDPANVFAYRGRAFSKYKLGDYVGALDDFDVAIAMSQVYAPAFQGRALAKNKLKDYRGALADFKQAEALDPDDEADPKS